MQYSEHVGIYLHFAGPMRGEMHALYNLIMKISTCFILNQSVFLAYRTQRFLYLLAFAIQNIVPGDEQEIVPDG